MDIPFILGAYASHPAPEIEADYYQLLAQQEWVSGVEIPYPGQRATQMDVLAAHLAPHWDFNTIAAIPGTMQHVWKDGNFGLASPDEAGREAALAFTRQLCDDLDDLCDKAGRLLVGRVQLHSAPTCLACADAFKRSFEDVVGWDWSGATLVVEHCDKYVPSKTPKRVSCPSSLKSTLSPRLALVFTSTGAAPSSRGAVRRPRSRAAPSISAPRSASPRMPPSPSVWRCWRVSTGPAASRSDGCGLVV